MMERHDQRALLDVLRAMDPEQRGELLRSFCGVCAAALEAPADEGENLCDRCSRELEEAG